MPQLLALMASICWSLDDLQRLVGGVLDGNHLGLQARRKRQQATYKSSHTAGARWPLIMNHSFGSECGSIQPNGPSWHSRSPTP